MLRRYNFTTRSLLYDVIALGEEICFGGAAGFLSFSVYALVIFCCCPPPLTSLDAHFYVFLFSLFFYIEIIYVFLLFLDVNFARSRWQLPGWNSVLRARSSIVKFQVKLRETKELLMLFLSFCHNFKVKIRFSSFNS